MDTTTANMWTGVKIVPERQLRPMPAHLTATLGAAPGVGAALPPLPPSAGRRRKWQPPKPAQAPKFDAGPTAESSAELLFGHYWPESKDAFQATLDGASRRGRRKAALQGTIDEAEAKEQNAQEPGSPVMEQPSSPEPGEEQWPPRQECRLRGEGKATGAGRARRSRSEGIGAAVLAARAWPRASSRRWHCAAPATGRKPRRRKPGARPSRARARTSWTPWTAG